MVLLSSFPTQRKEQLQRSELGSSPTLGNEDLNPDSCVTPKSWLLLACLFVWGFGFLFACYKHVSPSPTPRAIFRTQTALQRDWKTKTNVGLGCSSVALCLFSMCKGLSWDCSPPKTEYLLDTLGPHLTLDRVGGMEKRSSTQRTEEHKG